MRWSVIATAVLVLSLGTQVASAQSLAGPEDARAAAVTTICTFTAPTKRDCDIARDWPMKYTPYILAGQRYAEYNTGTKVIQMAWPVPQATFTSALFHEIQHAKDAQDGLLPADGSGDLASEARAWVAQEAILGYMLRTSRNYVLVLGYTRFVN